MAIELNSNSVKFDGVIYENELASLREHLQSIAPEEVTFDFKDAQDVHLAILQIVLSYQKMYTCNYLFSDEDSMFKKTIQGFDSSEEHCN
jgi:hypothetical protein